MAKNSKVVLEGEYHQIKRAYRRSKLLHRYRKSAELCQLIGAEFGRSPQTVLYVMHTKSYKDFEEFKAIHNQRQPESTLGKKVKAQGKRLTNLEAHLYGIGALNASDLL